MRINSSFFALVFLVFVLFGGFVFVNAGCGVVDTCSSDVTLCTSSGDVSCFDGCNRTTNFCSGREYLDGLNRTISVDYLDNSFDVNYDYWGDTDNVHNVYANNRAERYEYDFYGNLIGEFYGSNEDKKYSYNLLSKDMPLSTVSGNNNVVKFEYYSNGNLKSESVIVDGKKLTTKYEYDSNDNVISIANLVSKKTFEYDNQDRLIYEGTLTKKEGNQYQENSSVEYVYDDKGNIVRMIDGTGLVVEYGYQDITYTCQEYNTLTESFVDSQCTYSNLVSKKINNYTVTASEGDTESYSTSTGGSYTPNYKYDSEGYLTSKDNITYSYSKNYSALNGISMGGLKEGTENSVIDFAYSGDGELGNTSYASELGPFEQSFGYDPLDRIVYEELTDGDSSTSILSGNVIKNIFTAFAIFDSPKPIRNYYASAGDSGSAISESEYTALISPENIWPELAEEYNGSANGDWLDYFCFDSDVGENETTAFGAVDFGLIGRKYDSCQDNMTLIENYCGEAAFQSLDFWTLKTVPKTFTRLCAYGCSDGRCQQPADLQCLVDTDCEVGLQCVNNVCVSIGEVSDLPPEPSLPIEFS